MYIFRHTIMLMRTLSFINYFIFTAFYGINGEVDHAETMKCVEDCLVKLSVASKLTDAVKNKICE